MKSKQDNQDKKFINDLLNFYAGIKPQITCGLSGKIGESDDEKKHLEDCDLELDEYINKIDYTKNWDSKIYDHIKSCNSIEELKLNNDTISILIHNLDKDTYDLFIDENIQTLLGFNISHYHQYCKKGISILEDRLKSKI